MKNLSSKLLTLSLVLLFNLTFAGSLPVNNKGFIHKKAIQKAMGWTTDVSFTNQSGAAFTYMEISGIDGNDLPYSYYTLTPLASGSSTSFYVPQGIKTIRVRVNTATSKEYGVDAYDQNDSLIFSKANNDTDDFIFTLPQTFDSAMSQLSMYFYL